MLELESLESSGAPGEALSFDWHCLILSPGAGANRICRASPSHARIRYQRRRRAPAVVSGGACYIPLRHQHATGTIPVLPLSRAITSQLISPSSFIVASLPTSFIGIQKCDVHYNVMLSKLFRMPSDHRCCYRTFPLQSLAHRVTRSATAAPSPSLFLL